MSFLVIVATSVLLGRRSERLFSDIREGHVPALEFSRDLETILANLHRTLLDASSQRDPFLIQVADSIRGTLTERIEQERGDPVITDSLLAHWETRADDYYELSRGVTEQVIEVGLGLSSTAMVELQEAGRRFVDFTSALEQETAERRQAITEALAAAAAAQRFASRATIGLTIFALLVLLVVSVAIIVGVLSTLSVLSDGLRRIGEGDFTVRIPVQSNDEFGRLSAQMNATVDAMREALSAVTASAGSVADAAQTLSGLTVESAGREGGGRLPQVAAAMGQLAQSVATNAERAARVGASSEVMAQDADGMQVSVAEVTSTVEQLAGSITLVAERMRAVDRLAKGAAELATSGGSELASVISEVDKATDRVSEVVTAISDFADQTQLLALNAAIEAARAHAAGSGFAVVAKEIGVLAERSLEATRSARAIVHGVRSHTTKAAALSSGVIERITKSADETRALVSEVVTVTAEQEAGARQIREMSERARQATHGMAEAARVQAGDAGGISGAVHDMDTTTREVSTAAAEVSSLVSAIGQRLIDEARRLREITDRFTI